MLVLNCTLKLSNRFLHFSGFTLKNCKVLKSIPVIFNARAISCFSQSRIKKIEISRYMSNKSNASVKQIPQQKKRLLKKKKLLEGVTNGYCVVAYSTAEEYNLETLSQALPKFSKFQPTTLGSEFDNLTDFVHAEEATETENRHLFFFREGSVVMWNVPNEEVVKILDFLRNHEDCSFNYEIVKNESEVMSYSYSPEITKTGLIKDSIIFSSNNNTNLEKYAISNAMALSVTLGTFESTLEKYIEAMEPVTEDLKAGNEIKMSREEVLRRTGKLFALRHNITLSSDLLDTPDFYWDQEELEKLYQTVFNYYCIYKRTRVINEKINHCIELVQLLSSHLNDKHHVRLEWMIIILIMVEVAFEVLHYVDRFLESRESSKLLESIT